MTEMTDVKGDEEFARSSNKIIRFLLALCWRGTRRTRLPRPKRRRPFLDLP
jgi:hypothetical protein